jgi:hypothetical protein
MRLLTSLVTIVVFVPLLRGDEGHHHALTTEEIGTVHFMTSCSKGVENEFNRAVALLHSFEYEQARSVFEDVAAHDPACAMAQWGIAMSHYHGLWNNGDADAGGKALQRAQQIAGASTQTSKRELAYIDALAVIYKPDDQDRVARAQAFEHKMAALQAAYPEDNEAAIFHALTLDITAPKTDKTFANQRKCGEILEPLFTQLPHHPGIAHYIVHCYDNPVLAEKGIPAARLYAQIAPASAHANHMPSHIFTRVGHWDDSIHCNRKSAEIAAEAEATSKDGEARDQRLHAMDYLEYAYLQSGRVKQAKAVLDEMNLLKPVPGQTHTGGYALSAIPARYHIELGQWDQASELQASSESVPWVQAITWAAVGVGGARSHHPDRAAQAQNKLAELRDALARQKDAYWSNQVEVQRLEVAAWTAEAAGKSGDALSRLRSAAELEESMDKNSVTPGAVTPAREMLAELLLLEKHPEDSLAEYEAVLRTAPNRFNALYGAASAADAAHNEASAHRYFERLTQIAVGNERHELVTARKKIAVTAQGTAGPE